MDRFMLQNSPMPAVADRLRDPGVGQQVEEVETMKKTYQAPKVVEYGQVRSIVQQIFNSICTRCD